MRYLSEVELSIITERLCLLEQDIYF